MNDSNALSKMTFYIERCSERGKLEQSTGEESHLLQDSNFYSLRNLIEAKQDKLLPLLGNLCLQWSEHIHNCPVRCALRFPSSMKTDRISSPAHKPDPNARYVSPLNFCSALRPRKPLLAKPAEL